MLETWLIMRALNLPVSLAHAMVVETFDAGIAFAAFMIPARAGVQEAGHVAAFVALGLGAPIGLAYTVVRRLRQAVWAGLGYLTLMSLQGKAASAPTPAPAVLEPEA
jgi:glycosyltransferase 2 family protein